MQVYPDLDIRFPENKEAELIREIRALTTPSWSWQEHDPMGRLREEGRYYFHRDVVNSDAPCTLCIKRKSLGHLVVANIVPDANSVADIPLDDYVRILREFDTFIAEPAAKGLDGMTSIGTHKHTLEDYFSTEAIGLLEAFCQLANGLGSHPCDQERWMKFLLHLHCSKSDVHCDVFGACLREKRLWPEEYVADLVREYEFAMRLLRQFEAKDGDAAG